MSSSFPVRLTGMSTVEQQITEGYAPVNGVEMYWRSQGEGGTPLVVVHGGFGVADMFGDVLDRLAEGRRVIAVELQGHGHTRDIDREFSCQAFGDDLAALVDHLGLGQADLMGYSLGAAACLRAAIQHPARVRRLVVVSTVFRRDGWYPEVLEGMAHVGSGMFEQFRHSPPYAAYAAVAPDVDAFPALMDKTGALLAQDYDWTDEVRGLRVPTLLVYADADGIPPSHAAEFFALLGGGLRDAGWDGAQRPESRLAILPGHTHYDVFAAPLLVPAVAAFLA
jgi:pimeloyl-ACP methyl ester carboxylesterase